MGAPNNTSVTVGSTTTQAVAANQERSYLVLSNDSDEVIYLGLGGAAVMNKGIRLNANGGTITFSGRWVPRYAINAICASGSKNLCVYEETF